MPDTDKLDLYDFDALRETLRHNSTNMGELGVYIRLEYVLNAVERLEDTYRARGGI